MARRLPLLLCAGFWLCAAGVRAPGALPFSDAFTKSAAWSDPQFLASWPQKQQAPGRVCRMLPSPGEIFGCKPEAVMGWFENGKLTSMTVLFLDSGEWFGYVPDAQAKMVAQIKGPVFTALYKQVAASVSQGLETLAGNKGRDVSLGQGLLKQQARLFHHGDLFSRLTLDPDQLVKVSIFPSEQDAASLLDATRRGVKREETTRYFATQAKTLSNGDCLIEGVPVIPQGDRAYCGVSTLAMAMRYLGGGFDTEDYAAAAKIRFGSTVGSKIKEVYDTAGANAAIHFPKTTKFEFDKAKASIDAGLPVVVFRHWSQERDYLHAAFARRFSTDSTATLPKPDLNDQKLWPTRDSFAHASIVNGYPQARGDPPALRPPASSAPCMVRRRVLRVCGFHALHAGPIRVSEL